MLEKIGSRFAENSFAFLSETFTPAFGTTNEYVVEAFWIARRENWAESHTVLHFGLIAATFPEHEIEYENLDYVGFLQEARHKKNPVSSKSFLIKPSSYASIEQKRVNGRPPATLDFHGILTKLLDAFPNLPHVPSGTDGWYTVGK